MTRRPSSWTGLVATVLSVTFLFTLPSLTHAYSKLSDASLRSLPRPGNDFDIRNGALLSPILRTRVPGTPGSAAVLEHFVKFFKDTLPEWKLEFQNSTSKTPVTGNKNVPFVNLIAHRDPPKTTPGDVGRLTLVAHYDSKLTPKGFIGAIDSAAPCAMLLHSMRSIDAALTKKWSEGSGDGSSLEEHQGIQVILLDGEEAFYQWTPTDSLYGARSLAETMEKQLYPALSTYRSPLSAISLFVLLDLLGSKDPTIPSYFKTTHWAYKNMATLESRLRKLSQFKSSQKQQKAGRKGASSWFPDASKSTNDLLGFGGIQDDHLPFMARGVDILHLIPSPFPDVWHKIEDDAEHLDMDTVEDWSTLVTAFTAEWLGLEGHFDTNKSKEKRETETRKTELT